MSVYAIVRQNTYDPEGLARSSQQLEEFQALHARQPGYQGTVIVDAGDGRWLVLNLWETEEHASAALAQMVPGVRRLLEPIMAGPSQVLAAGNVVLTDLARR